MTFTGPIESAIDSQIEWRDKLLSLIAKQNAGQDVTLNEFFEICNIMSRHKYKMGNDPIRFPDQIAHLHEEVSEAYTEWRKGHGFQETYFDDDTAKPQGIPVEMADVILKAFAICGSYDIPLLEAINIKQTWNATRRKKKSGGDYV